MGPIDAMPFSRLFAAVAISPILGMPFSRLFVAVAVGSILGMPFWRQPGGIRTHMLVAVGATMFCVTSTRIVGPQAGELLRVIQGIASGVGFVGAATVLKHGGTVRGVNVAASIWITAAISCEVGFGNLLIAMVLALVVAGLSHAYEVLDRKLLSTHRKQYFDEDESPESRK